MAGVELRQRWPAPEGEPVTWAPPSDGQQPGHPAPSYSPPAWHGQAPWSGQPPAPLPSSAPPGLAKPGGGPSQGPQNRLRRAWQRFVAVVAAIGGFLAKFGALLLKLKYFTVIISMLVSIAAYTWLFGWTFAVGFVLLILVHELGHVLMLKRQGVPSSLPIFIPFMGAFVNMKQMPRSAYQEAQSGLAGPATGTAAALVVEMWGRATGSSFLMSLAFVGFFLNIFNLLPALPLDGGRAAAALHPAIWLAGLLGLVAVEVLDPSPVIPIIILLGGFELWQRWRRRGSRASQAYFTLLPKQRLAIAAAYLLILGVALVGFHGTYAPRSF